MRGIVSHPPGHRWSTRRALGALNAVFALVLVGVLLGSCGSSGSSSGTNAGSRSTPDGNSGSAASGASAADTITWAKSGEVRGLDPQVSGALVSWDILYRVYEPLVQAKDDGTVAPWLATSWKRLSPVEYEFQLRHDVRYSNGRLMTADDVVVSFERVLDPKLASYHLSRGLGTIDTVTAIGRYAVRFKLKKPDGTFPLGLAGIGASILPGKELKAGTFDPNKALLGTGPYKVAEHLQNQSWTLERNPHYWRKGYPRVDKLVVLIIDDPTARMAALRSGRADIATSDDPDTPDLLEGTPNVRVIPQATSDFYVLDLNAIGESSRVKDEAVRQAIAAALDRRQIIDLALGGAGDVVGAGAGTVPRLPDSCDTSRFAEPNLDEAKRLVADAGADGLSFDILAMNGFPIFSRIGQVIQSQLEELGLKPVLRPMEDGAAIEKTQSGEFDGQVTFMAAFVDNWFGLANWSPSLMPFTKAFSKSNPEFNGLLTRSSALGKGTERAAVFQRMCDIAAEQANIIPLATRTTFVAYRDDRIEAKVPDFEPNTNSVRGIEEYSAR